MVVAGGVPSGSTASVTRRGGDPHKSHSHEGHILVYETRLIDVKEMTE